MGIVTLKPVDEKDSLSMIYNFGDNTYTKSVWVDRDWLNVMYGRYSPSIIDYVTETTIHDEFDGDNIHMLVMKDEISIVVDKLQKLNYQVIIEEI